MSVAAEEILEEFLEFDIQVDDDSVSKLEEIASVFSLSAEELVNEWVAYSSRNDHPRLTYTELEHLERELTNSKAKCSVLSTKFNESNASLSHNITSSNTINNIIEGYCSPGNKAKLEHIHMKTPISRNQNLPAAAFSPSVFSPVSINSTPSEKYSKRNNAGEVVASLSDMENFSFLFPQSFDKISCQIKEDAQTIGNNYKYMFQKVMEVCDILSDMIEEFAEKILQENLTEVESFASCCVPCQSNVFVVGRVKSENMARLTPLSVVLEGDRIHSFGRSVHVDLCDLNNYSLFPGQLIAMRGVNPSGNKFVGNCIYCPAVSEGRIKVGQPSSFSNENTDCISMIVASGPFTTSDTLNYEPLTDLIEVVKKSRPDITVLIGPLVDCNHKELQSIEFSESASELATKYIKSIKNDLEDYTQIVFVPSLNDVFHHPVYPQPPYIHRNTEKTHFMSNPSIFHANDLKIGATSADILFHLGAEEISKSSGSSTDRLARLVQHLLVQKNFYPLYPSHESIPVDIPASEFRCKIPSDIDILLVPSDLRCFVKCLKGRLCINPGRLAKGLGGGTYARVVINSAKEVLAQIVRI